MTRKYFGTDGVRGKVGELPITPEFVMHLGYAAGKVLAGSASHTATGDPPAVLIGKDTRISGYMLESALQAGSVGRRGGHLPERAAPDPCGRLPDPCLAAAGGYRHQRVA